MNRTINPCFTLAFCCCLALSVTGCGQRGPLYLPEKEPPPQDTAAEPAPEETSEENDEESS